ncbi:cobalamin-5'-phosphate synthase [Peptoclostridium litorale DSM 5388]|uniref:Adenosylcobinamide-GDP ribazoletransferase n=1 Tax=Peptoclostridium litorale DSM 5388 TaxID=1121324 RepID=A0A069RI88_PEPLI|nr:adenosylcobinamide-GDP ribazoletransferase [Peptoclostridium litorale]KDR96508.1 cobalamin synthase CobS [Peptoclostridium litorale DSM 5388]SIN69776.1 cobalamin-5'-phosphate synthase [Peptoclostridium litorale DSM 5388]
MKRFLLMLTFFTRLPVPYPFEFKSEDFEKGVKYTPFVGVVIGMLMWGFASLLSGIDKSVYSLLVLAFYIWISGGLHIDGVADSVDGIFSGRNRERVLEIMKDSNVGTFGSIAIFMLLLSNLVMFYHMEPTYLLTMAVAGRSCVIIVCYFNEYAREEGMGKSFVDNSNGLELILALTVFTGTAAWLHGPKYAVAAMLTIAAALGVARKVKSVLGGITGDTHGLVIEFSQTMFLVIAYLTGFYV